MNKDRPGTTAQPLTIAVTATFTANGLQKPLAFWLRELELPGHVVFAPYGQVFQELLDPAGVLGANRHGVNVVLVRLEDWLGTGPADENGALEARIDRNATELVQAVRAAAGRSPACHLVFFCPASPGQTSDPRREPLLRQAEGRIAADLDGLSGVHVVTSAEREASYPVANPHDPQADKLAHVPYTPVFFTALATLIARKVHALSTPRPKVVVFDADDTLWDGRCGEDGPRGVRIDAARSAVQEFLVRQHDAGMLLCLCSRNNEEDVVRVFEDNPDMVLRRTHLVGWRVNWRPKSENLRGLARELGVGADSVLFLDDDPVQCAEVQANCPEVLTLPLPRDAQQVPRFLRNVWAFDRLKVTEEGRGRTSLYRQNQQRQRLLTESLTLKDFLAGLGVKVRVSPLAPDQLPRAAELTQRTNQFNLVPHPLSEAEVRERCRQAGEWLAVHVKDRFGSYGMVGLMAFREAAGALAVQTFLLSCRVLGRGVEHRMLAWLGDAARQRAADRLDIAYVRTGKNQPALDFLQSVGARWQESREDGFLFRLPAEVATAVRYDPPGAPPSPEAPAQRPSAPDPAADARTRAALLRSIAAELSDVEAIHEMVAAQVEARPESTTPFVAPQTPLEKDLAEICARVLGLERVGVNDNFFHLGGHSLLATQVLARVREAFQVELSPRLLYTGQFTVAELAGAVARQQIDRSTPQDVAAVLSRLDELSDDEVRALLGEQAGHGPAGGA